MNPAPSIDLLDQGQRRNGWLYVDSVPTLLHEVIAIFERLLVPFERGTLSDDFGQSFDERLTFSVKDVAQCINCVGERLEVTHIWGDWM
ncbi:UNVERIFIED_ORG: hypothetical protein M2438_001107 [Methylobacterium sp. SuP10 SLI 274]|nr:hypothetical protein [Methylorubrum extorquens]MDF9862318.1 hypothetical protein [Methylorubrum pseudosasae]MDH6635932.1 hypothetical protein [Methylobacterium sp. SuP10 SLI 274]MDH6665105.1 hypothetical protein [Methylorubrum zatmanii]